jgi:hypothetical protein
MWEDADQRERIHAAAVLTAGGDATRFKQMIELGRTDWRDLLMASGSGNGD